MSILQEIINDRSICTISQNLYCKKDAHLCFFFTALHWCNLFFVPPPLLRGFVSALWLCSARFTHWMLNNSTARNITTISIVIYRKKPQTSKNLVFKQPGLQTLSQLYCSVYFSSWCLEVDVGVLWVEILH